MTYNVDSKRKEVHYRTDITKSSTTFFGLWQESARDYLNKKSFPQFMFAQDLRIKEPRKERTENDL